jgi:integrase
MLGSARGRWCNPTGLLTRGHVRTIPIPRWAKEKLDRWTSAATISTGRVFRAIRKNGTVWDDRINVNVVWHVVNRYCRSIGLEHVAPPAVAHSLLENV